MKPYREGQLVTVAGDGAAVDGIIFHAPSLLKAVVAVPDADAGAVFRTVHAKTLTDRRVAGGDDEALRRLIAKTASPGRGGARGGGGPGNGARGHTRAPAHRATGR